MACHFRALTWLLCAYGLFVSAASVFASDAAADASNGATAQAPNSSGAAKTEVTTAPADETGPTKPKQRAADVQQLEGLVVVGSRLPAAANQTSQDVHIYDEQRIEESGQYSISEFLATLPEVSLATPENATLATTVRLRDAIFGSPLVLINGRRTQPTTGGAPTFGLFDLNTIPLSLVERIEVLPIGSSAIYGGDALAGVVNIVLRSDVTGIEADAGYKWANNTHQTIASLGGGWKSDKLSYSVTQTASRPAGR
jgi:iron complex outermembrane receptor protein